MNDVALLNGVTRQTVRTWLRNYASGGMPALADKSSKPQTCPHQMSPVIEARVLEMRRQHQGWGPRSIRTHLEREGFTPVPGRSSIYRTLVRHGLIEPTKRKRSRAGYKRWERSRSIGAVADGHRRPLPFAGRDRAQSRQWYRRPQPVLRQRPTRARCPTTL